jgi:F-box domain
MNRIERHDWPDAALAKILMLVPPRTISSLRCVSKSWRDQISYTLTELSLQSDCDLKALLLAFPSIGTLSLTLGRGLGLPMGVTLHPLSTLANLTNLVINGPDVRLLAPPIQLNDAALAQIAVVPRLTHLTLVKVDIDLGSRNKSSGLQDLVSLKTLRLRGVKLQNAEKGSASVDFFSILANLQGLEALEIDELSFKDYDSGNGSITPSTSTNTAASIVEKVEQWSVSLSVMKNLKEVRLGGSSIPITDELCCAVASLPKLSSLELSRPGWWGYKAEASENMHINNNSTALASNINHKLPTLTEDVGLAALAARASTLRHLALHGCFSMTSNAAVHYIAALTSLTSLDLRTYSGEEENSQRQNNMNNNLLHQQQHNNNHNVVEFRGACLARLTTLKNLEHLHLGGWPVSVATARALGRFASLRRLDFSSAWDLGDSVVFELAKMNKLQHLALRRCVAVSDIGLAALAKGPLADSLTALDLKGCHRNVTDQGLAALKGLTKLQLLDVSGCELVSDLGVARGLAKMKSLEQLGLSDTQVSDYCCSLLATAAPLLRVVHIEHCLKITDTGADALARLTRLYEVRAFGSSMSARGGATLREKTGAVVSLYKPCWWSKTSPGNTSSGSISSAAAGHCGSVASSTKTVTVKV